MKQGFTLIEIMIVMLIIGFMATIGIPKFMAIGTTSTNKFIRELNDITSTASQFAIKLNSVQKIFFNLQANRVELLDINSSKSKKSIDIPKTIEIENIYINGQPQFTPGARAIDAYFLINSDGISQEVKIIFTDKALQAKNPRLGIRHIQLNPFITQFQIV